MSESIKQTGEVCIAQHTWSSHFVCIMLRLLNNKFGSQSNDVCVLCFAQKNRFERRLKCSKACGASRRRTEPRYNGWASEEVCVFASSVGILTLKRAELFTEIMRLPLMS